VICALIHGFAGGPSVWDEVIDGWQLPDAPRAIALPGHGGGPVRDTWQQNLEAVAEAIDRLRCDCVVGYSLGARVALGLVVGGMAAHGVLIGVNPGIADELRPDRAQVDAAWARLLRTEGVAAFDDAWTKQALFASQARVDPDRRLLRRERRLRLDPEQLARSLEVMGLAAMPDYWGAVAPHRDRIALLAGAEDAKYVAIAEGLPCASFEVIADSGHDPTLEQPAALAGAIRRAVQKLR